MSGTALGPYKKLQETLSLIIAYKNPYYKAYNKDLIDCYKTLVNAQSQANREAQSCDSIVAQSQANWKPYTLYIYIYIYAYT